MKSKYFYDGVPLVEYCKKHPEIKYGNLTKYISVELKKDSSRTAQELIEEFINKSHRKNNRYLLNGMSLLRFCELNNISYQAVSKEISRSKTSEKYAGMEEDERINTILDRYILGAEVQDFMDEPKQLILKPEKKDFE